MMKDPQLIPDNLDNFPSTELSSGPRRFGQMWIYPNIVKIPEIGVETLSASGHS